MPSLINSPTSDPIPAKDDELAAFATNFATQWLPATFGSLVPLAATIANANDAYKVALASATNPISRTPVSVGEKNARRAPLELLLRQAIAISVAWWKANPQNPIRDANILNLGIRIPSSPSPIGPPVDAPIVGLVAVAVGTVKFRFQNLVDGNAVTLRRLPRGVSTIQTELSATGAIIVENSSRVNLMRDTTAWAAGTNVSVRSRYMTGSGLVGPWCASINFAVTR